MSEREDIYTQGRERKMRMLKDEKALIADETGDESFFQDN